MYDRLDDIPVLAWTDFQVINRDNIHEPVACTITSYHANATLIVERTLEAMKLLLGEELMEMLPDDVSDIIEFKPKND